MEYSGQADPMNMVLNCGWDIISNWETIPNTEKWIEFYTPIWVITQGTALLSPEDLSLYSQYAEI